MENRRLRDGSTDSMARSSESLMVQQEKKLMKLIRYQSMQDPTDDISYRISMLNELKDLVKSRNLEMSAVGRAWLQTIDKLDNESLSYYSAQKADNLRMRLNDYKADN